MSRNYGNLGLDDHRKWTDPIEDFIEEKRNPSLNDKEPLTEPRIRHIRRVLKETPAGVSWKAWDELHSDWIECGDPSNTEKSLTARHGEDFYNQMREEVGKVYAQDSLRIVAEFLGECMKRGIVDANPAAYVLDNIDNAESKKDYPEKTVAELGAFIKWIPDPYYRAACTVLAKWGLRKGEALNIDLPFLHLDHPAYFEYLHERGIELHEEVVDYPDSIFIPTEPTTGKEFRGEIRDTGNKGNPNKKGGKLLPVDYETKHAILDYLAIRENTGYPYPLWVGKHGNRPKGPRWNYKINKDLMKDFGFATDYIEDPEKNMDIHYFRHFFTTNMQEGQGTHDADLSWHMVQILRGDIGGQRSGQGTDGNGGGSSNLHTTYTHDWGNQIREPYLRNIYQFGIYD